ncbi:MAG: hypothetical protein Q3M24_05380 [Candidatus Electrothrix aestuarii]|uniref:DNA-binding protein n=1 Tax=Candidatus Electrothrix aestuarii TaxID=3062594 RepID=A0AAU8LY24_9BACT
MANMHPFPFITELLKMPTAEDFLELETANQVAAFFGKTYKEISEIFYQTPKKYKYRRFEVSKRSGGTRIIYAPNRKIKEIQQVLARVF